jgi:hypothetical protein
MVTRYMKSSATKKKRSKATLLYWARMKEVYYADKGKWKAWLPFYGPTSVREVDVRMTCAYSGNKELIRRSEVSIRRY